MLDGDKIKKTRCRAARASATSFFECTEKSSVLIASSEMPMAISQNVLLVFTFRHLPSRSLGNAVRNLRVVDLSGESLRTDTDGEDGDVAVRVAAALPANQGTFGESAAGSVADAAQRAVKILLVGRFAVDVSLKSTLHAVGLVVR